MGDYQPSFRPGERITRPITGTVTGGRLVTVAGIHAAADSTTWLGVASRDAVSGDRIVVHTEGVQRLVAAAAIAAGDRVKCAAAGKVTPLAAGSDAYDRQVGIALEAAAADGDELDVKLIR